VSGFHVIAALAKLPAHRPQAPILVVPADSTAEVPGRAVLRLDRLREQAV
jgi:hypothetical protein